VIDVSLAASGKSEWDIFYANIPRQTGELKIFVQSVSPVSSIDRYRVVLNDVAKLIGACFGASTVRENAVQCPPKKSNFQSIHIRGSYKRTLLFGARVRVTGYIRRLPSIFQPVEAPLRVRVPPTNPI
jgi:hypothetical protein